MVAHTFRMWLSVALMVLAGTTAAALAQEPATAEHDHAAAAAPAATGCAMMAQHKETMAAMSVADQRLAELVARMNAAKGEAKVNAIAAVVSEIAAQRAQMTKMQGAMMEKMSAHKAAMHAAPKPEK